jgi:membrane protein
VPLARRFAEHELLTYASAVAFRALVALVPLVLLALALLGALGLKDVWRDTLAPGIEDRVTRPVFAAIDSSVEKILSSGTAGLITFAALLLLWDLTWAVVVVMRALNRIHEIQERRSWTRRLSVAVGLAVALALCLVGAALIVATVGRVDAGSVGTPLLAVAEWLAAIGLLVLAVGLLVRYASAERPGARWASAGSIVIVASWIVASLVFRLWVTSVANFKTATGQLTVFLLLTAYVLVSSAIFLLGVELDELLRQEAKD